MQQQIVTTIDIEQLADLIASKLLEKIKQSQDLDDKEKLITAKEVCSLLKISVPTLNKRLKLGLISTYTKGKRALYKEREILKLQTS